MPHKIEGDDSIAINWLSSLSLWLVTILASYLSKDFRKGIINLDFDKLSHDSCFWLVFILYLLYLILQFSTTGFRKFIKIENIRNVLKTNIENSFEIKLHGKSWDFEENTDSEGNTTTSKVVTYNEKIKYKFKSGADCSKIIIDSNNIINKRYLLIEIEIEEICADEKTKIEYEIECYNLNEEAKRKGQCFSFTKKIKIPNSHSKNIITLSNSCIIILDRIIYIICI